MIAFFQINLIKSYTRDQMESPISLPTFLYILPQSTHCREAPLWWRWKWLRRSRPFASPGRISGSDQDMFQCSKCPPNTALTCTYCTSLNFEVPNKNRHVCWYTVDPSIDTEISWDFYVICFCSRYVISDHFMKTARFLEKRSRCWLKLFERKSIDRTSCHEFLYRKKV